ncbi:MAG: peptidylprolyl isomerase [Betaproteobacteria bacterium]|nr:MAG: peptidylprolyl isomerase [Betaproteobacteria bacterium]
MKFRALTVSLAILALPALALAQAAKLPTKEAAKPAAASREGPLATVNGVAIPRQRAEFLVRQQTGRGAPDSEQLRTQVREVLINNEIIMQEASRSGIAKRAEVQSQLELARQEIIVNSYLNDYIVRNPVTDAEIQLEYERAKQQTGTTEYKARHILVKTEEEAKRIIGELKKGGKFEEQAQKHSLDSTKDKGGDLDWNVPGVYDKTFADALVKLEKGKMSEAPVRSRFGFHVIQLDDVRPVKIPPLAEVKPRIQQRLAQIKVELLVRELRGKAKVE